MFAQEMADKERAFLAEQQIKKWLRAKKEALIAGEKRQLLAAGSTIG